MQAVFDGHNDVLLRLWRKGKKGADPVRDFADAYGDGHIDGPRAQVGGLKGGLCAVFVSSGGLILKTPDKQGAYATPLAEPLERLASLDTALEMIAIAFQLGLDPTFVSPGAIWRRSAESAALSARCANGPMGECSGGPSAILAFWRWNVPETRPCGRI